MPPLSEISSVQAYTGATVDPEIPAPSLCTMFSLSIPVPTHSWRKPHDYLSYQTVRTSMRGSRQRRRSEASGTLSHGSSKNNRAGLLDPNKTHTVWGASECGTWVSDVLFSKGPTHWMISLRFVVAIRAPDGRRCYESWLDVHTYIYVLRTPPI